MSQPMRYWIDDHSAIEDGDGKWVLHSDYADLVQQGIRDHADWRSKLNFMEADYKAEIARLTAENERLQKEKHEMTFQINCDDALVAENERLRKAGDDLERDLFLRMNLNAPLPSSIAEWNAAKEGRDAK